MLLPHLVIGLAGASPAASPTSAAAHDHFARQEQQQLVPLLVEVLAFPTQQGNLAARQQQAAWLKRTAEGLGFGFREGVPERPGTVVEIDLPGKPGAPVLGLMVHGDVVTVEGPWSFPPFSARVKDGFVEGRGAADDKGPLVQALLAMRALQQTTRPEERSYALRLLVGSDEESDNEDVKTWLAALDKQGRKPPDLTLVLDSEFPVVAGEMSWNALSVAFDPAPQSSDPPAKVRAVRIKAGTSPSIVPDRAELELESVDRDWEALDAVVAAIRARTPDEGTRLEVQELAATKLGNARKLVVVTGRASHSGVNIENGRNALLSLARVAQPALPPSGIKDLLELALFLGQDLHGKAIGLVDVKAGWKPYNVNVGTVDVAEKKSADGRALVEIVTNVRRPPPWDKHKLRAHLEALVKIHLGAKAKDVVLDGYYGSEPLELDPHARIVQRLLDIYARSTGERAPFAISGGGTYAKRLPSSIPFGMWFGSACGARGRPYPGHDVDERVPIADLVAGTHVLLEALVDLTGNPPLVEPFRPDPK